MAKKQQGARGGGRSGGGHARAVAANLSLVELFLKGALGPDGEVRAPEADEDDPLEPDDDLDGDAAPSDAADCDGMDEGGPDHGGAAPEAAEEEPEPGPVSLRIEGAPALPEGAAEGLARDAERLLIALERDEQELSIVLCDDAFIRPLNASWRGKDSATDVLSFPQEEPEGAVPGAPALGDLVISAETAAAAAAQLGHSLEQELKVLLVHGVLHLIGHDHEQGGEQAARMRAEEARLLPLIGGAAGLIARTEAG